MSEIEIGRETKTGRILDLALQQGDTATLDLMDRIWGDTVYERLCNDIEETTEEEKDGMLEELGGNKPLLNIDKDAFIRWYFDSKEQDEAIDYLLDPKGTGEIRLIDILRGVGHIPISLVKNKENVQKEDRDDPNEEIEEPGEIYRLEFTKNT